MGVLSMKKYAFFMILALIFCWLPHLSAFDGEDRMLLARTISGMAETEPEEVARMIGEVALNRAADSRFPSDLRSVLDDYRQFRRSPTASLRSLQMADRILRGGGERLLPPDAFYFEKREGGYAFFGS
jgi:hypothetical protein